MKAYFSTPSLLRNATTQEGNCGEFGVRKYDDGIGRFTSIDALFEKFVGWTPYQYSANNPINAKDDNGIDTYSIQQHGTQEGEEQKKYVTRTKGEFAGETYEDGKTGNLWHNGAWVEKKRYIKEVILPIVDAIYKKGPSSVNVYDFGIDGKSALSNNFGEMIDKEVSNQAYDRKMYYFNDGTQNPFYNDAIRPAYFEFMFLMGPSSYTIGGKVSNYLIKTIIKQSIINTGSKIESILHKRTLGIK